jgi:hypothetical protein
MRDPVFQTNNDRQADNAGPCHAPGGVAGITLALTVFLAFLGFGVGSARAAETHVFQESFGPDGTAATAFEQPAAIGVDQSTGEVYVADYAAGTVQKFNSAHEPGLFTGIASNISGSKLTGFSFRTTEPESEIAVNSSSHDFYVVNNPTHSLRAYQSDGEPADFTEGPGTGTNEIGGFNEVCGVAVDANGDIYASDFVEGVKVYAPTGKLLVAIPATAGSTFCNLAVDSNGTLYLNHFNGAVEKFTPSTFPVTSSTTYTAGGPVDENVAWGVAVDPATNDLYVDEHNQIAEYDEAGTRVLSFAAKGPGALTASEGLAVNAGTGQVYVSDAQGKHQVEVFGPTVQAPEVVTGLSEEVKPRSATLNGTVNPGGIKLKECTFEYGETEGYGQTIPCAEGLGEGPGEIGKPTSAVPVHANVTTLQPGTTYHFRLKATTEGAGYGEDATLKTPPPPAITGETATNLTAVSEKVTVDLNASINPGGLQVTTCLLEWGTTTEYGHPEPCEPEPGAGTSPVAVHRHIEKLEPNIPYHWRVIATNEAGTTTGPDHTFIYDESTKGVLPDNRAYEMVTPPQKNGALIGPSVTAARDGVSADGSHLVMSAIQCFAGAQSCPAISGSVGSLYAFDRSPGGWATTPLAPSAETLATSNNGSAHGPFSPDLRTTLFAVPTPPFGEEDFYARDSAGAFHNIGPVSPPNEGYTEESLTILGGEQATADLSHLVFEGQPRWPLSRNPFDEGRTQLFEYIGSGNSTPMLVGVSGGPTSADLISACSTQDGAQRSATTLSASGQSVYFTARACASGTGVNAGVEVLRNELFARIDNGEPDAHTVAISQPRAPQTLSSTAADQNCESPACQKAITEEANWRPAQFQHASSDGTKVFFTTAQQLTDNASQDPNAEDGGGEGDCNAMTGSGCNLYLHDFAAPAGHSVIAASAGDTSGGGPRVQGVVATSADGSHVYFVAKGVLTSAANGEGKAAQNGGENLYVFAHESGSTSGHLAFIATLSAPDAKSNGDAREWEARIANVTPDGRFLVFLSSGALTPDVTRTDGAQQVFRYDAATGELVRLSVGEQGFNDNGNAGAGDANIVPVEQDNPIAGEQRADPTMAHDGSRVFFVSSVGLTPGALNGVRTGTGENGKPEYAQNVYEWEQAGTPGGSCPAGAPRGGCVYLISDGHDADPTGIRLVGSDATGSNVFFSTLDRLLPQDTDTEVDIYDARVCSAASPCVPPVPAGPTSCLGEACRGIPPARAGSSAGPTATLNGAGNMPHAPASAVRARPLTRAQKLARALSACHKKYKKSKKRRATCEKQAHKRYGPSKANRATRDRRGK